jgi:hypothetical protein
MIKRIYLTLALIALLISSFANLFVNPSPAFAAGCTNDIDVTPLSFLVGSPITLNFKITNPSALNNLRGQKVHLIFGTGIRPGQEENESTTITSDTFSFTLTDGNLQQAGSHQGRLTYDNMDNKICDITYQVGVSGSQNCQIGQLPPGNSIPPNSPLTVRFLGVVNHSYQLRQGRGAVQTTIGNTTTDAQGQGSFGPFNVSGSNGETVQFIIVDPGGSAGNCQFDIQLNVSSQPAPPPNPGPVGPPPPPALTGPNAKASGDNCDPTNNGALSQNGNGISTAIGCIPTEPVPLITGLMRVFAGLAGGIAILLMASGSIQMMVSGGSADGLKKGRDQLVQAGIGLLFVFLSVTFLQIIGVNILNLPGFQ